jgi:hypothetical protein
VASSRPELRLDWCSHEAAKYAVEKWHYSRRMPKSKLARIGVWEGGSFVGVVLFGYGATPEIGKPFGLLQTQIVDLVRVALRSHASPVSRMVAVALRMVRRAFPGLRLVVSFSDTTQGHHGGIYQAGGWLYLGADEYHAYRVNGVVVHPRVLHLRYGSGGQSIPWLRANVDRAAERIANGVKHKYGYPLDDAMRAQIAPLAQPYPKRAKHPSDAPSVQDGEGGAAPTRTLQEATV